MMIFSMKIGNEVANKWYASKGYAFMEVPGGFPGLPETWIHTNKPLNGPDDLKGLKMRASGDAGAILATMGVGTVYMPLGDVFQAMQTGVIDAFECSCPAFDYTMGLEEAAKYQYISPSRAPTEVYQFLVSKDKFNALPNDLKQIVLDASLAESQKYHEELNARNQPAIDAMTDYGNIFAPLPTSINEVFSVQAVEYYKEQIKTYPELEDYMVNYYLPFAKSWSTLYGFSYPVMTSLD